jgi:hypothetical protein
MRWLVDCQIGQQSAGVAWLRQLLAGRDTSGLAWLRVDFGRGRKDGAYGRCWYPTVQAKSLPDQCTSSRPVSLDDAAVHKAALPGE